MARLGCGCDYLARGCARDCGKRLFGKLLFTLQQQFDLEWCQSPECGRDTELLIQLARRRSERIVQSTSFQVLFHVFLSIHKVAQPTRQVWLSAICPSSTPQQVPDHLSIRCTPSSSPAYRPFPQNHQSAHSRTQPALHLQTPLSVPAAKSHLLPYEPPR